MSNLIKSVSYNANPTKTHIIDSDKRLRKMDGFFVTGIETVSDEGIDGNHVITDTYDSSDEVYENDILNDEEKKRIESDAGIRAAQIIEEAQMQASKMLEQAQEEATAIRESAKEEGMREGILLGNNQAASDNEMVRKKLVEEYNEKKSELDETALELEPKFAEIMISLIEKITGVVCEDKKDIIVYLIDNALYKMDKTQKVTVRVSKEDMLFVVSKKNDLKQSLSPETEFDIVEDPGLTTNQCIIETDDRVIDCSLDVQIDNLKQQIKLISLM